MKRRIPTVLTCILACAAMALASCGGGGGSGGGGNKKYTISMIPKGATHAFWLSVKAGAESAAADQNVNLVWVAPEREDSTKEQQEIVETQAINRVDGICLAPSHATALRGKVQLVKDKYKVPVLVFDSGLTNGEDLQISYVATDNFVGGQLGGESLGKLLGGKGKVILLRYMEGSESTEQRENGFMDAIKKFPDIEVVSDEQHAGATASEAQKVSETLLLRFSEGGAPTVDGIFCVNASATFGMMQALRRNKMNGKVKFVGFDAEKALVDGLKSGDVDGLVVQDPYKMGKVSIEKMVAHLDGGKIEQRIDTGVVFVSGADLEKPDIKPIIAPQVDPTWKPGS